MPYGVGGRKQSILRQDRRQGRIIAQLRRLHKGGDWPGITDEWQSLCFLYTSALRQEPVPGVLDDAAYPYLTRKGRRRSGRPYAEMLGLQFAYAHGKARWT